MNVTRDVITDLLPVYFSGEASEGTKQLVEDYFHEDPDFERIARRAATPLETLRKAAPVPPEADKEKQDLQWARDEFVRRRLAFGLALLFTFAPLMNMYSNGHLEWTGVLRQPWLLMLFWSIGALSWFQCFSRLSRRTTATIWSVFFALLGVVWAFHLFLPGWQTGLSSRLSVAWVVWAGVAIIWVQYFRLRRGVASQTAKGDWQRTREQLLQGWLFFGLTVLLTGLLIFTFHLFSPGWPTDVAGVLWLGASVTWYFRFHRMK